MINQADLLIVGSTLLGLLGVVVVGLWLAWRHLLPWRAPVPPGQGRGPFDFPAGFQWGTATADHQIERSADDDWSAFEREARAGARSDKGKAGHIHDVDRVPLSWLDHKSDWNTHWRDDLARARDMGHTLFRCSVSWARLFPTSSQTEPDAAAVDFYAGVFAHCRALGLAPMVTLFHFASPRWLWDVDEAGARGVERADAVPHFQRFAAAAARAFGDTVTQWCTLNEPMVWLVMGYRDGRFPPLEQRTSTEALLPAMAALLRMHAAAYAAIHDDVRRRNAQALVGVAHHVRRFLPWSNLSPLDRITARYVSKAFVDDFIDAIQTGVLKPTGTSARVAIDGLQGTQDFLGVNDYGRLYVRARSAAAFDVLDGDARDPREERNDLGWATDEEGLARGLVRLWRRHRLPLWVTESGAADGGGASGVNDVTRQRVLVRAAHAVWGAQQQGADVRGYAHWSLVDNFEWAEGFGPRFGLYAADYDSGARTPRGSVALYRDLATSNQLSDAAWQAHRRR